LDVRRLNINTRIYREFSTNVLHEFIADNTELFANNLIRD